MPLLRRCLIAGLTGLALIGNAAPAVAQSWPERPVRVIVPYAPGGVTDILARTLSARMAATTGQSFVVENRSGASGNLGAEIVARATPDGYTIMIGGPNNFSSNQFLFRGMSYSIERDLTGIALLAEAPSFFGVPSSMPVRTMEELLAYGRANPNGLNCGSPGNATTGHMMLEMLKARTGLPAEHVPFRGQSAVALELVAGRLQCVADNLTGYVQLLRDGSVRALAVTATRRSAIAPDVPTMAEAGIPDFTATSWFAFAAASATPRPLIARMNAVTNEALANPEVVARIHSLGATVMGGTADDANRHFAAEAAKWKAVIEAARISLE